MRNYQPKKNNPYHLDHHLFMRINYMVKDYSRMKEYISDISCSFPMSKNLLPDGGHSDPTMTKVIKIERLSEECRAIESSLEKIPPEYQKIIFDKICYDKPYPLYADPSTFSRHKCRFIYYIAKKLLYI